MDLIKIGAFLAQLRKEQGLSQAQLGAQLGVSNKTVSRWETGTYLPPAEMLLALSERYGVSINELLSARRLTPEAYPAAAEENLRHALQGCVFSLQERLQYYKSKWCKDHRAALVCIGVGILGLLGVGLACRRPLLAAGAVVLLAVAHSWRHNAMMAYAEGKVFGPPRWE